MKKILAVVATIALLASVGGTVFAGEWYITHEPVSSEDFSHEQKVRTRMYQQTAQCLNVFGSRRIAELQKEFHGKLFITFFDPVRNITRVTTTSKREVQAQMELAEHDGLEIVLYGRHAERHPRLQQGLFQYDASWKAVFMPAFAMTKPWFCGVFLHELFHASEDRRRIAEKRPRDAFPSPILVDEEVRAHELEREVLDAFTGGQYILATKTFIANEKGLRVENVHAIVQKRDIPILVHLFPPASEEEMSLRRAQVFVDITFLLIEKGGGGVEEKRKAYIRMRQGNRR